MKLATLFAPITLGLRFIHGASQNPQEQPSSIPHDCQTLKLSKGHPQAKIHLFAETHSFCDEEIARCAQALKFEGTQAVLLYEGLSFSKTISCSDIPQAGFLWEKVAHTCKGWNWPIRNTNSCVQVKTALHGKSRIFYNELRDRIFRDKWHNYQQKTQISLLENYLTKALNKAVYLSQQHENLHKLAYASFYINESKIPSEDFYSTYQQGVMFQEHEIKLIKFILKNIRKNKINSVYDALSILRDKIVDNEEKIISYYQQEKSEEILRMQNKYLIKSIREISKNSNQIFLVAGGKHVSESFSETPAEKEIVLNLEKELKEFENTSDFAIWDCLRKDDISDEVIRNLYLGENAFS